MLESFATIATAILDLLQTLGLFERARAIFSEDDRCRALQTALMRAYAALARNHPGWVNALFDKTFLESKPVIELLAELLTRHGRPDPAQLAKLYAQHLGFSDPERWPRLKEAIRIAADLLTWLKEELAKQDVLRPLYDSRALDQNQIAQDIQAIRAKLERDFDEAQGRAQRYAQIAGNVSNSAIVTGDHNVVTQIFLSSDYAPLSDLYIPPDSVFARVRLAEFSGREWL
jgi:hypothetical protein